MTTAAPTPSDLEMRQAFDRLHISSMSYEEAMQHPALSLCIKNAAVARLRKLQNAQHKRDPKRLASNDN